MRTIFVIRTSYWVHNQRPMYLKREWRRCAMLPDCADPKAEPVAAFRSLEAAEAEAVQFSIERLEYLGKVWVEEIAMDLVCLGG